MMTYNTLIVLAGTSLLGVCSGLVGTFAVLRRRALMGDALAHAALPGLCVAFLILGERNLPGMLFGALVSGILGVMIVSGLRLGTRIKEDAAIGIVLSVFYGVGIALSRIIQNQTVSGSKAGLESYILGKTAGMIRQDVYWIGGTAFFCLLAIWLLYKEFKAISFDTGFARAQGWPVFGLDLLLMTLIAVTVVIGLPAVGVVMMAALLIIPAAAARFWTEQLSRMLLIAALFGGVIGIVGTLVTSQVDLPSGPVIVLIGSGLFLTSLFGAPRRGLVARWWTDSTFERQLARRTALRILYELSEAEMARQAGSHRPSLPFATILQQKSWTSAGLANLLNRLEKSGDVRVEAEGRIGLTESGWKEAVRIVLDHRRWEGLLTRDSESAAHWARFDRQPLDRLLPPDLLAEIDNELRASGRFPSGPGDAEHPVSELERPPSSQGGRQE